MSFLLELLDLGMYSIGAIMTFLSRLYSMRAIGQAFYIGAMLLFSISHTLYLEASTESCSFLFKTCQTRYTEWRYKHITMMEKVNIIILVMQNCCIRNSTVVHTTMSLHVIKRFYKADFKLVCYWDFQR